MTKKYINHISTILLIILCFFMLFACKNENNIQENEDKKSLEIVKNLNNFSCFSNQNNKSNYKYDFSSIATIFYCDTHLTASNIQEKTKLFCTIESHRSMYWSEGSWEEIAPALSNKLLATFNEYSGKIFLDFDFQYATKISEKNYKIEAVPFFKQAFLNKYLTVFGDNYDREKFEKDFEKTAPLIYGDMSKTQVSITINDNGFVLQIDNSADKNYPYNNKYVFYDIGTTSISLPTTNDNLTQ